MSAFVRTSLCFAVLFAAAATAWAQAPAVPPDLPAPAQASFKEALGLERRGEFQPALTAFTEANKRAGGSCAACLEAMYRTALRGADYKNASSIAGRIATLQTDPAGRAHASLLRAEAGYRGYFATVRDSDSLSPKERDKTARRATELLVAAEHAASEGLAADASNEHLRFLHAAILGALKRDEDASREFAACAAAPGLSEADCLRARHLAANAAAARDEAAPEFSFTTMDGKPVSRASLAGKIVLLDFWATWCTFCRRDSDYVQSLLDSFEPGKFQLVEVNVDEEEGKWKGYVEENRLKGVQVHDGNDALRIAFGVSGYPTYIILDGDSQVRFRISGAQGDLRGTVKKLLAEQAASPNGNSTRTLLAKPAGD